ncbi:DnaJ domain-containing protein [Halovivax gelatinilyticus]|uniref:DnaJ domain-containing protein n=1 Tax=Halovivax gelatinilyticus TaxID=2961597 RepID=UPI0020CA69E0|nr:DnaJ domain-containing protein [Halovivax gelatinilyticus]
MGETFYDVLGIGREAASDEIDAAYRERVLETHPDRNDAPDAADAFKRVCDAHAVLGDPIERARYDRIGHDSYCRSNSAVSGTTPSADSASAHDVRTDVDQSGRTNDSERKAGERTEREGATSTNRRRRDGAHHHRQGGPSHHARHRARRQRRMRSEGWWESRERASDRTRESTDRGRSTRSNGFEPFASGSTEHSGRTVESDRSDDRSSDFTVHSWTDEVDLASEHRTLDPATLLGISCVALLYPLFVFATVAPVFPLGVNAIVGLCTIVLVGYLLTFPRVALVAFGTWAVLAPAWLALYGPISPISGLGLVVLGAFWTPLGYAIAVSWALKP